MIARGGAERQSQTMLDLRRRRRLLVGAVSDTHGVLDARVAARLDACDLIVHAGDVGTAAVLARLRAGGARLAAVRGNNDHGPRLAAEDARALARLPARLRARLAGGDLVVEHGDGHPARDRHRRLRAAYPGAAAIVYGHSHRLLVDCEARPWLLNPGAGGRARTFGGPSCLLLEVSREGWQVEVYRAAC